MPTFKHITARFIRAHNPSVPKELASLTIRKQTSVLSLTIHVLSAACKTLGHCLVMHPEGRPAGTESVGSISDDMANTIDFTMATLNAALQSLRDDLILYLDASDANFV